MPHHGLISRDCPVACLLTVLSRKAWNPLTRASSAPCDSPETVGDVLDMRARHQLGDILGLGPRRIGEIEAALVLAGLDLIAPAHMEESC